MKCGHGSTIGRLDEEALFYLRCRGIGLEEVRSLLIYACASKDPRPARPPATPGGWRRHAPRTALTLEAVEPVLPGKRLEGRGDGGRQS